MYTLTLTYAERKAIDWVGYRYGHGDNLRDLLEESIQANPIDDSWDDDKDITFRIPENLAWAINDIGEECEFRWDCFVEELAAKMNNFCAKIV